MEICFLCLKNKDIVDFTKPCCENVLTGVIQSTICFMVQILNIFSFQHNLGKNLFKIICT